MKKFTVSFVLMTAFVAGVHGVAAQGNTPNRPGVQSATKKASPALVRGRKIVAYARARLGQRLGRGECTDLVVAALSANGAKPGNFANPKDYIWGRLLSDKEAMQAGDIIQFEGCQFETRTANSFSTQSMPHHTAIVASASGKQVVLLHQNAPIGGGVVELSLDLRTRVSGTVKVYRTLPR